MTVELVLACLADTLDVDPAELDADAPLTALGLESFTAVRLRRRLREEAGADLPLTAFLGAATARSVAMGGRESPDRALDAAAVAERDGGSVEGTAALTPIQAAYLVGRDPAFPLGGVATHYYTEYDRRPDGDPLEDLARLRAAWNRLVARHPMLRAVIGADGRQRVLPSVPDHPIEVSDLRGSRPDQVRAALAELRSACSHAVRPADRWPLFGLRAALLPDGRTRLLIGIDVLAVDLASWLLILREWGALVTDPGADLPAPPVTFFDLLRSRDEPAERARRDRDRAWWAERAAALPAGPALPWTRPLVEVGVPRFVRHAADLPAPRWSALRRRAAAAGLSPTGVLLAAFALVLQRHGAGGPFCLNTTLFDREDLAPGDVPGLDRVVGDFTSTVLVEVPRADLRAGAGFGAFAAALNRRFWEDLDHRAVSGVEVLAQRRGEGGVADLTPTHPVVFTSGVGLAGNGDPPAAWLGEEVFGVSQTPQVALDHIVHDEGGRLRIAWDVVEGLLPAEVVAGMVAAHARLLGRLAADAEAWTDPALGWDPSFLPDAAPPADPWDAGPLLDDPLRAAAAARPDRSALLGSGGSVTHGELCDRAAATAAALAGRGLGPGDLVAVAAEKGPAQVAAVLGVAAAGAAYVPVEPSWPAARVSAVCARAGIRHALVGGDGPAWPDGVAVHRLDGGGTLTGGPAADPRRPGADELAYVIFTSGSTGAPKGVAVEHRAARTTLDDLAARFPLEPTDRVLALSALSFDLSVYDVFAVLGAGGALVLPDADRQRDPGHWLDLAAEHGVSVWNTAPALLEMLVEYAEVDPAAARRALATLRLVLLSGDWIPVTLPDRLRALAPTAQVVSLGGATEAAIWSICHPIGTVDPAWRSIPYGRALRGQSFAIVGDDGAPAPVGVAGELLIGGAGLARGYAGDPEQTAERFVAHPVLGRRYRTGDLGRWRPDGTIEFLGRLDRQVKVRGHRIELGDVEAALDRAPGVRQAVARAVPGPDGRPRLVAYVVAADPAAPPSDDDLVAALRARVPDYMVPSRFVRLDALPVTGNGKVDARALPNPYPGGAAGGPAGVAAPGTAASAWTAGPPTDAAAGAGPDGGRAGTAPAAGVRPGLAGVLGDAPAPANGPALARVVGDAVVDALARGLGVSLVLSVGGLPPGDALAEAGTWARDLRAAAARGGLRLEERLGDPGLLAVDVASPGGTGPLPAPAQRAATVTGAAASRDGDAPPQVAVAPSGAGGRAVVGPDPAIERAVARVLSDLLDGPVDVTTPFFRLGATSLTLVLAHRRLRAELDPGLSVVDLFARPTVRDLALELTRRRVPASGAPAGGAGGPARATADRLAARARARAVAR